MGPSKKKCRLVAGSQADPHARHNNDANDTSRHRHHHHSQKDDQEDSPDLPPQLSCRLRVGDSDSESDSDSTTLKSSEECVDSRQEEDLVNLNNEALQQSLRNEVVGWDDHQPPRSSQSQRLQVACHNHAAGTNANTSDDDSNNDNTDINGIGVTDT
jgi:hypothetical protein